MLIDKANEVSGKSGDLAALVQRMNWSSVLLVTGKEEQSWAVRFSKSSVPKNKRQRSPVCTGSCCVQFGEC